MPTRAVYRIGLPLCIPAPCVSSERRRASSAARCAFHAAVAWTFSVTTSSADMSYLASWSNMPRGTVPRVNSLAMSGLPCAMRSSASRCPFRRRLGQGCPIRGFGCGVFGFVRRIEARIVFAFNRRGHLRDGGVVMPLFVQAGNANPVLAVDNTRWPPRHERPAFQRRSNRSGDFEFSSATAPPVGVAGLSPAPT